MFFVFSQIIDKFDAMLATENNWIKICIDNEKTLSLQNYE